jgi:hypothetical protein
MYTSIFLFHRVIDEVKSGYWWLLNAALLGIAVFLVVITKNVAMGVPIAFILCLLLLKKWKEVGAFIVVYVLCTVAFNFIEFNVYKVDKKSINNQRQMILLKDSYHPESGKETTDGFVKRFEENVQSYISKHFFIIMGLRSGELDEQGRGVTGNNLLLTVLTIALFTFAAYSAWKEKKTTFLLLFLIAGAVSTLTFLIQTMWDNQRLILTMVPVYVILFFYGTERLLSLNKIKFLHKACLVIFGIFVLTNVVKTMGMVEANSEQLSAGMSGNDLYGFPPPFESYIQMIKWTNQNVKDNPNERIACRKPDIAFVYSGGRDYYGIWRSPAQGTSPDSLYAQLKTNRVHYIIQDQIFSTVGNYLTILASKYPERIKLVHSIDTPVQTNLYKIDY